MSWTGLDASHSDWVSNNFAQLVFILGILTSCYLGFCSFRDAEKRAQEAEEKSETLHEELEEALRKLQDMEDEEPEFKDFGKKAEKSEKGMIKTSKMEF